MSYTKKHKTLCWDCEKACGRCSWSKSFTPVEGWDAKPTKVRADKFSKNQYVDSFDVYECPEFEQLECIKKRIASRAELKATWKREKEEGEKEIVELRKQGNTVEEIAYITGHCSRTIYRILGKRKVQCENGC